MADAGIAAFLAQKKAAKKGKPKKLRVDDLAKRLDRKAALEVDEEEQRVRRAEDERKHEKFIASAVQPDDEWIDETVGDVPITKIKPLDDFDGESKTPPEPEPTAGPECDDDIDARQKENAKPKGWAVPTVDDKENEAAPGDEVNVAVESVSDATQESEKPAAPTKFVPSAMRNAGRAWGGPAKPVIESVEEFPTLGAADQMEKQKFEEQRQKERERKQAEELKIKEKEERQKKALELQARMNVKLAERAKELEESKKRAAAKKAELDAKKAAAELASGDVPAAVATDSSTKFIDSNPFGAAKPGAGVPTPIDAPTKPTTTEGGNWRSTERAVAPAAQAASAEPDWSRRDGAPPAQQQQRVGEFDWSNRGVTPPTVQQRAAPATEPDWGRRGDAAPSARPTGPAASSGAESGPWRRPDAAVTSVAPVPSAAPTESKKWVPPHLRNKQASDAPPTNNRFDGLK